MLCRELKKVVFIELVMSGKRCLSVNTLAECYVSTAMGVVFAVGLAGLGMLYIFSIRSLFKVINQKSHMRDGVMDFFSRPINHYQYSVMKNVISRTYCTATISLEREINVLPCSLDFTWSLCVVNVPRQP